jgi:ribosomal protein S27E
MKPELEKQLIEKYPKIFQVTEERRMMPFSMFAFECGDGWYNILNSLCFQIQSYIDCREEMNEHIVKRNKQADPEGQIDQQLLLESIPQAIVTQVKEKFGTLRFYYDGGDDCIDGMVTMAEAMSAVTCETCGDVGELRGRGWYYTACDKHAREEDKDE